MRGRNLIGLSNANRTAAGVSVREKVDVRMELDTEPITVTEPDDFIAALAADPVARAAYEGSTVSQRRQFVRGIEAAKKPETRARRIEKVVIGLREKG